MFLYLRSKLETVLKFASVVGLLLGIIYMIPGNWILAITSLIGALLFNVIICSINPDYSFLDLFKRGETYSLYSTQSIAPLTDQEEELMKKWKRQIALIAGVIFAIPGVLLGIMNGALLGFLVGYCIITLLLNYFLFLSREQAVTFIRNRCTEWQKKQWDRQLRKMMKVS